VVLDRILTLILYALGWTHGLLYKGRSWGKGEASRAKMWGSGRRYFSIDWYGKFSGWVAIGV